MATQPIRVAPPPREEEQRKVAELYRMLLHDGTAALVGPDNSKIELPPAVYDLLVKVFENMQAGKSVILIPTMEELSTQAAADILGVSRQFFVRECEAGRIPFHYTGTHRRVFLKDVCEYRQNRSQARRAAVVRMAQKAEEIGDYDTFIPPEE